MATGSETSDRQHGPANPAGRPMRLASSCLILTAALLTVFPAFACFGFSRSGVSGVAAAAVAGIVCWLSGLLSLVLLRLSADPQTQVHAALLGLLFRMGPPFMVAWFLTQQGGSLARAGVLEMILVYYLVALLVDTLLSVWLMGSGNQSFSKAA